MFVDLSFLPTNSMPFQI